MPTALGSPGLCSLFYPNSSLWPILVPPPRGFIPVSPVFIYLLLAHPALTSDGDQPSCLHAASVWLVLGSLCWRISNQGGQKAALSLSAPPGTHSRDSSFHPADSPAIGKPSPRKTGTESLGVPGCRVPFSPFFPPHCPPLRWLSQTQFTCETGRPVYSPCLRGCFKRSWDVLIPKPLCAQGTWRCQHADT